MPKPKPTWKDMSETKALVRWLRKQHDMHDSLKKHYVRRTPTASGSDDYAMGLTRAMLVCIDALSEVDRLSTRPTRARKQWKR